MEEHPQARQIVETLNKAGFVAYYAGGWVRDLLLNHPSDDIDIATNAPPETIQKLFPKTVPVGIAFGIVIVVIDGHEYEVATFRQDIDYQDGRRPTRIEFTTAEEDAKRRDFTINGMFYDPLKQEVLDFVGGRKDLEAKVIRAIGDPHERIREDRLRMIRAIRLSCRFDFSIDIETQKAIRAHATELFPAVAIERVWQELTKGHQFGKLRPMLIKLHEFGLLAAIFPALHGHSLDQIKETLEPIGHYPAKAPVIASLLPLLPKGSHLELCKKFKLSNLDTQFAIFLTHADEIVHEKRPVSLYEWAYFYANGFAPVSLQILSAHLEPKRQAAFLHQHEERMLQLDRSIERIRKHDPVVKSDHLIQHGVKPGVGMGKLLKEAELISINEQLHDTHSILERLKSSPLWPS